MSKLTRKCPNCGATVPADVKYCRKCHARLDSGRVEVLAETETEPEPQPQRPKKRNKDKDALRNLPRPVRPVEDDEYAGEAEDRFDEQEQDGFFPPDRQDEGGYKTPAYQERRAPVGGAVPRPVSTARGGAGPIDAGRDRDKNLWQIITVLAIILVIIVVAIVLVIKLNQPAGQEGASDPYEGANVITSSTAEPSPMPLATNTPEAQATPEGLIVPQATPVPAPTATPVTVTPVPAPTATPIATPAAFSVTAVNDTVYISGNGVNVRSGPGTDHSVIGSENSGKQLQRTGRTSNGWSQVAYNGQTGYVIDSLLTTTAPASSNTANSFNVTEASGTVKIAAASGANLRTGPGTGYSVVAVAPLNMELTRTGTSGDWTRVSYNGQNVFVSTNLLASDTSGAATGGTTTGTTTGGNTNTGVTAESGTITVTGNGVRIRTGPGTNYSQIGSANSGNVLTVTGKSGDWYQISYNGQTAYISATYARKN